MENKKFNLSDKIWSSHEIKVKLSDDVISVSNVKRFIKILKEEIPKLKSEGYYDCCNDITFFELIDELIGDKLK